MKKAIEILNNFRQNELDFENTSFSVEYFDEAIKELKDLENRSCSNCKYNKAQDSFMIFCDCIMCKDGSKMMWHSFTKDFCCNKWENKA